MPSTSQISVAHLPKLLLNAPISFHFQPCKWLGDSSPDALLTGDKRLACEAIMCLSTGTRPSECSSSLSRYWDTQEKALQDHFRQA
ncbi:TrbM/KikA/MpfK family conjugal transfer protein [Achromobacter xylosoxidans]